MLTKTQIPTPALLLDLDLFESNLARMAQRVRQSGKKIRPHAKAHKCVEIARRQIEHGACGISVATIAEAELMAKNGIPGILLTSPLADPAKIARIAATRLGNAPRPLRLSYAGQVLRVKGSEIRPERQIGQVGAELIGAAGPLADVEAIAIAGEALEALGVPHLSVDITLPTLVAAVTEAFAIPDQQAGALRAALDHKDAAAVAATAGEAGQLLGQLLAAAGPAAAALAALDHLELPTRARAEQLRLGAVLDGLAAAAPGLKVTVDPVENRGFEYHTGISFTFFAGGVAACGSGGELGRGGRYQAGDPAAPEPATGFTLYTDTILRTLPDGPLSRRLLLPLGTDLGHARILRERGWITVSALEPTADWRAEARRLGCTHVLEGDRPVTIA